MGSVDDNDNFKNIHSLAENKLQSVSLFYKFQVYSFFTDYFYFLDNK